MRRSARPTLPTMLVIAALWGGEVAAQGPRPSREPSVTSSELATRLARTGWLELEHDDLVVAGDTFRRLRTLAPDDPEGLLGLGEVHLKLGDAPLAQLYAEAAQQLAPRDDRAAALMIRALVRRRAFDRAVVVSTKAVATLPDAGAVVWAAHASALFRVQRPRESARAYQRVLQLDPGNAEAHLRLGSGLLDTGTAEDHDALRRGVAQLRDGQLAAATSSFEAVLRDHPDHVVAHRLLGDTLLRLQAKASTVLQSPEFGALAELLPVPQLDSSAVDRFMPGFAALAPEHRVVAARALGLFESRLRQLAAIGGRHDLLGELERTTDAPARATLRGQRTFDGRVWDDVRGIGGLRAATGVEALDETAMFGFDTLSHELAHQVHLYVFSRSDRQRLRELYQSAIEGGWVLDYYAASNEAEYFGQGVEAFASYGKHPGREPTHGHTRFELYRLDRRLHDFIAARVDADPLRDAELRRELLPAAIAVALRCGRYDDAVVAAEMMDPGPDRTRQLAQARQARLQSRSY